MIIISRDTVLSFDLVKIRCQAPILPPAVSLFHQPVRCHEGPLRHLEGLAVLPLTPADGAGLYRVAAQGPGKHLGGLAAGREAAKNRYLAIILNDLRALFSIVLSSCARDWMMGSMVSFRERPALNRDSTVDSTEAMACSKVFSAAPANHRALWSEGRRFMGTWKRLLPLVSEGSSRSCTSLNTDTMWRRSRGWPSISRGGRNSASRRLTVVSKPSAES